MSAPILPFLVFYIGAVLVALTRGTVQKLVMLAVPLIGAANLYAIHMGSVGGNAADLVEGAAVAGPAIMFAAINVFDYNLSLFTMDKMSLLFGILFHIAAFLGVIFSLHVRDSMQHVAGLLYAGSALGAVFAGDMIVLFVFWEMLALTSVFLILARRSERATRTGMRYLLIQVLSGVLLLAGVLVRAQATGSIAIETIGLPEVLDTAGIGAWLIFLAIGIKCCFPLLHNWLTDAYPEATPTGTVFLSAFTTKVAVYALARCFAGTEMLVYVGAAMAMFPIFFAVIENDLRRVLAYSLINQIGFMVCGIGIGTALAVNGAIAHAFNDVIFKGLLFMTMGAVLYRTGRINGSDLGGLYKSMPWTAGFCLVGAASISAFPLFSGFVSKSMVMVAALEGHYEWVWLALLFASAGVFHHAGIKIPYFAFFAHDSGLRPKEAPFNMLLAMGMAAALCIFNGSYPWLLYSMLPYPVDYEPYTAAHVLTQCQLLFFSALAFVWLQLRGLYPPELPSTNLDFEWIYRKVLPRAAGWLAARGDEAWSLLVTGISRSTSRMFATLYRHHGPEGILGRQWPTGNMALWTTVVLGGSLLAYYWR